MNKWQKLKPRLTSIHTLLMILVTLGYLLATHLSTINSLEMALASKAERSELELLDKKLTRIEVKLEEVLLYREEFYKIGRTIERQIAQMNITLQNSSVRNTKNGQ